MANKDSVQLTAYAFQHTYKCHHHCPYAITIAHFTCVWKCYIILYWVCCSFVCTSFHTTYLHHVHPYFIQYILFWLLTALLSWVLPANFVSGGSILVCLLICCDSFFLLLYPLCFLHCTSAAAVLVFGRLFQCTVCAPSLRLWLVCVFLRFAFFLT